MGNNTRIKSIQMAFELIEGLERLDGARASTLAEHVDKPVSTVHDYLKTLEEIQYVTKQDNVYRPGTRFLEIGEAERMKRPLYRVAEPELASLAEETGELASLMVEEHGNGVLLDIKKGEDAIQLHTYPGVRMPLHTSALGKSILAHLSDDHVDEIIDEHGLPAMTKNTVTSLDELEEQFVEAREQGYVIDRGERIDGVLCLAAPILSRQDHVLGAICVCSPTSRIDNNDDLERIKDAVMRTANMIQVNLNYSDTR